MNPTYDRLLLGGEESRPVRITLTARQSDVDLPARIESALFGDFFSSGSEGGTSESQVSEQPASGEVVTPENAREALEYAVDDVIDRDSDGFAFPLDPDEPDDDELLDSFGEDGEDDDAADFWKMIGNIFRQMEDANSQKPEEEPLVAIMPGVMEKKRRADGGIDLEISYEDAQLADGTRTVIRLSSAEPDVVTVTRSGDETTSMMICEEGVRHVSMYRTPYAVLELAVLGRRCESTVNWMHGGVIRMDYLVEFHGADLQYSELTIKVEPM